MDIVQKVPRPFKGTGHCLVILSKTRGGFHKELKTVDTFGNCQRPVFSLGVSQHMHDSAYSGNMRFMVYYSLLMTWLVSNASIGCVKAKVVRMLIFMGSLRTQTCKLLTCTMYCTREMFIMLKEHIVWNFADGIKKMCSLFRIKSTVLQSLHIQRKSWQKKVECSLQRKACIQCMACWWCIHVQK